MRIMVSGNTKTVNRLAACPRTRHHLGVMIQPNQQAWAFGQLARGLGGPSGCQPLPVVADNAAFSNPNPQRLHNMLVDLWQAGDMGLDVKWVAVPDVVGDAAATLDLFHGYTAEWAEEFGCVPWRLAFVAQDGLEAMADQIPWDRLDALFIGGSTDWKLGPAAAALAREARGRGKWVHVGRVNSLKRLAHARDVMLAHSVDGTGYTLDSGKLEDHLKWLAN